MAKKRQFMALVEPETMSRLDALRIVLNTSRARVGEMAWLGGGLHMLETAHEDHLLRLQAVAQRCKMSLYEYADGYAEVWSRTYGPTLEQLEKDARVRNPFCKPEVAAAAQ